MNNFKEFQFGWLILIFVLPAHILITYFYVNDIGANPIDTNGFILATVLFFAIYFLFYGLTTTVTQDFITLSFGIGLIRKQISLRNVEKVIATKNNHLYGWGIRFIPKGMLYNMSGSEAVELKFKDSDRVVRIGTQNTTKLQEELVKRLTV